MDATQYINEATAGLPVMVDRPQLILTGGGMGSGKTTILTAMEISGGIRMRRNSRSWFSFSDFVHAGCDEVKFAHPFYREQARRGNYAAGDLVHRESCAVADELFTHAIQNRMHVVFDGCLKRRSKLEHVLSIVPSDYHITIIGVTVSLRVAAYRAMMRALRTRNYIKADRLIGAHASFAEFFTQLLKAPREDLAVGRLYEMFLLANDFSKLPPTIVAYRGKDPKVTIFEKTRFDEFSSVRTLLNVTGSKAVDTIMRGKSVVELEHEHEEAVAHGPHAGRQTPRVRSGTRKKPTKHSLTPQQQGHHVEEVEQENEKQHQQDQAKHKHKHKS